MHFVRAIHRTDLMPKKSKLSRLKAELMRINEQMQLAEKPTTRQSLANRIVEIRLQIDIEKKHKASKFNRVIGYEIPSGSPGLGKRKS